MAITNFQPGFRLIDGTDLNNAFTLVDAVSLENYFAGQTIAQIPVTVGFTIPAAAFLAGWINRTGPTANFTDTTDTAANLWAALTTFFGSTPIAPLTTSVIIKNNTAFQMTLTGGTGVTISGGSVIPPNGFALYNALYSSASSATFTQFTTNTPSLTPQTIINLNTVGNGTITAAGINGRITSRGGTQSATAFTDTTDTAANIISGATNLSIGSSFVYSYSNTTNAPATITGGTGVTVSGVTVAQANEVVEFLLTQTAAATITMIGFLVAENSTFGTFTANGTSAVTVTNSAVSPNSQIGITLKTVGGTVGAIPNVKTITPGTGFTISGTASDTSVYNYAITY